jgi:hypothetical protein
LEKAKSVIREFEQSIENQFLQQGATRINWAKRRDVVLEINC